MEALESVERRMASAGGGARLKECIQEPAIADLLGLTPLELQALDADTAWRYLGYHEGKSVGEWARNNPAGKGTRHG